MMYRYDSIYSLRARGKRGCFNKDMEEIALSRRGKLYAYTIGHMASMHFQPSYAVGFVDMPEGVRVFAPLKMTEGKPSKVGMDVEVVVA